MNKANLQSFKKEMSNSDLKIQITALHKIDLKPQ